MAKNLLFEIGVEEIPARFMAGSLKDLKTAAEKGLREARLSFDRVRTMGTPRRLTLFVDGLAEKQDDFKEEVKGPSEKAAFDGEGNPTKALSGFLRSKNLTVDDIVIKEMKGGAYVFATVAEPGKDALTVLPKLLVNVVLGLKFPKPMRWSDHELRFIRPIHWIVALLGKEVIPLSIVDVESGNISRSHRFYGNGDITIESAETYIDQLRENIVMVDPEERKAVIREQISVIEKESGVFVEKDEELLEEVVFLLEYPTALMGSFEEKYLRLPKEVVITPMKEHQRYFPVTDGEGHLLPHFVTVRNGLSRNLDIVTAGNEKVLRARLADAEFFYEEDLKMDLGANVERLKPIVFHITMGTLYEKVERMVAIAAYLAGKLGVDADKAKRGAYLAKADLVSNMVYEFPELQGIMGEYYSVAQGEDKAVGQGIRESYLPRFAGDDLPETLLGSIVSIADKIDSIVGFFSMDLEPSGSQDPYALRRQAMGITQIILNNGLALSFGELIDFAYDQIDSAYETKKTKAETKARVYAFMAQRLENVMSEEGLPYDTVNAVMTKTPEDFCLLRRKGEALAAFRQDENFEPLMAGFTRVHNLAKNAEGSDFEESLLRTPAEEKLVVAYQSFRAEAADALVKDDFERAFHAIAALRGPIDYFLNDIMVMCEDEALRKSRLGLLKSISDEMLKVADFTSIVMAK